MPDRHIAVFAGPSLSPANRHALASSDDVRLLPPAQRGDVLRSVVDGAETVVLLDGYYYDVLAVGHKELLLALGEGVHVIGAASMGALRAVELAPFGMIGVGRIFEAYRDGRLDGDDEVAMLHGSAEHGYRATTIALVELRAALDALALAGAEGFLAAVKALGFVARLPDRVRALATDHLGEAAARTLFTLLAESSQKHEDAHEAIATARLMGSRKGSGGVHFPHTEFLSWDLARFSRLPGRAGAQAAAPIDLRHWMYVLAALHPEMPAFVEAEQRRFALAAIALRNGLLPAPGQREILERQLRDHLRAHFSGGVLPAAEIAAEAKRQALAETALSHWGETRALALAAATLGLELHPGTTHGSPRLERPDDLDRQWELTRALLFTEAAGAAWSVAEAAQELSTCFLTWSNGKRLTRAEIERTAARLWHCTPDGLNEAARARGLAHEDGPGPTLEEAMRWLTPAERLQSPINSYSERKRELCRASLELRAFDLVT